MKRNIIILVISLVAIAFSQVNYGLTVGGGIGIGIPFADEAHWTSNLAEYNFTTRGALILGEDQVFTLGLEYTLRYQQIENMHKCNANDWDCSFWFDGYDPDDLYLHNMWSSNIGISLGMNLNRNPVWWTVGYDTYSKGPFFQSTIGLLASSRESNNGVLVALSTYISKAKFGMDITVSAHLFGNSYKRDEKYEDAGAIAGTLVFAVMGIAGGAAGSKGSGGGGSNGGYYYKDSCRPNGCVCNDGWISYAEHTQGACSWHGGMAYKL